jgi:MFS family permease
MVYRRYGPRWYRTMDGNVRRAFWTSYAGFGLDAMNVQIYAFVLPVLLSIWGLSHSEAGLLTTVTLISSALGGWAGGLLADRFGRARMLTVTILCFAIATWLCGLARDPEELLIARALQGLGFGAEWAVGAVFIAEMASSETRARVVGMVQSAWVVGWGLAAAVSAIALANFGPELGWRLAFIAASLPAIVLFALRRQLAEPKIFEGAGRKAPWHHIFTSTLRRSTLLGCLLATGVHGGYWALATWWPTMLLAERGISLTGDSRYFVSLLAGALGGYAFGAWSGDRAGRRTTLATFALGGIAMVLAYAQFGASDRLLLFFSFPLGFVALGMFSVTGPVLSELFSTEVRGSGLGFCYNFGRGMAGLSPLLIGTTAGRIGIDHALAIAVGSAYGLVILAAVLLPETRGRVLD